MLKTFTIWKGCKDSGKTSKHSNVFRLSIIAMAVLLWTGSPRLAAETRVVVADPSLKSGRFYEALFGTDYRRLWETPIAVEVLDLSTEAGGLKPLFRVGGAQTFGLALKGADGKSYTFRSLVKEQGQNFHETLQGFAIARFAQDLQASIHPASNVMVPALARAAGVLHNEPRLIILPDDPALGEFRELFAGRLGTLEEFPTKASDEYAGFEGATDIIKSFDLVTEWLASPDVRVDDRALLRLRLFDFFLNDWDRHANNHRWAKLPGKSGWQPLPEDRDQAFVDFEGFVLDRARPFEPRLLKFEEDYPSNFALTAQGWPIHRWFLAELERDDWIEIANDLRDRITDAAIDEAASLMPEEYKSLNEDELTRILRARRDKLPELAEEMYRYHAAEIDVQATDKSERIDLRDMGNGLVEISLSLNSAGEPYFKRLIDAKDTKSLRVYMRGGQNILTCDGAVGSSIKIDVIGSGSSDTLQGCENAKIRFNEAEEIEKRKTNLRPAPDPFAKIGLPSKNVPPESDRPRDWRSRILPSYIIRAGSDDGLTLGGGIQLRKFAFGKNPFAQRHTITGALSLTRGEAEANYGGVFNLFDPRKQLTLDAQVTSIERADFFGFGNDTDDDEDSEFFENDQTRATITPGFNFVLTPEINAFTGAEFIFNSTDDDDTTLLNELEPIGVGDFSWANLLVGVDYDTRNREVLNSPGVHVRLQGTFSPELLDLETSYSSVEGEASGFFEVGSRSLVALRLGGRSVTGDFPFQEAAYLGGAENVRGLEQNRFAGDASVYGSAEFRYSIGEASAYVARAEYGVFAFVDVGRVFVDQDDGIDDSDELHPSVGIGGSVAGLDRSILISVAIATSDEGTTGVASAGFNF